MGVASLKTALKAVFTTEPEGDPADSSAQGMATAIMNEIVPGTTIQTITGSASVVATDRLILVNTDSAITLTIPAGLPVSQEFTVQRVSSGLTANGITLSSTDTFPVSSIFGNTILAKTVRSMECFTFRKVTATVWVIVAGNDTGGNANGFYSADSDGTMEYYRTVTTASYPANTDNFANHPFPKAFTATPSGSITGFAGTAWGGGIAFAGGPNSATNFQSGVRTNATAQVFTIYLRARGRWY